ncbi:MAG: hypothetical protein WCQ21_21795, partial [Verrucomicrobiota bacterium]
TGCSRLAGQAKPILGTGGGGGAHHASRITFHSSRFTLSHERPPPAAGPSHPKKPVEQQSNKGTKF